MARKSTARAQLKVRLKEPIRAKLERAAKRRGVSLNAEIVNRLEQTLLEDDAFGGPELNHFARLMASKFAIGGQRGAAARQHPEWKPDRWINDPACYQAAVASVVDALLSEQPVEYESGHPDEQQRALHKKIHDTMSGLVGRGYDIKVRKGDEE